MSSTHPRRGATSVIRLFSAIALAASAWSASAQTTGGIEFIPAQPTSADIVYMKVPRNCGNSNLPVPGYLTSNSAGRTRVNVVHRGSAVCADLNAAAAPLMVELGKFPAGTYPIDVNYGVLLGNEISFLTVLTSLQLVVTDHRPAKPAPAVFIDYSDHWWDQSDPGSGLFIWQNRTDQVLAAWFTYSTTGQAIWYTVQSGTWVSPTRYEGKLIQSSRSNPPPPPILLVAQEVGTAVLDFTGDDSAMSGRFIYKLNSAATEVTRNIRRFGK
ncbi:MAG: hypothetical protein JNN20_03595 [Betaproteobacteria bacterium]|nr:hypothetical protein [Betaproteobacteria bacterium]